MAEIRQKSMRQINRVITPKEIILVNNLIYKEVVYIKPKGAEIVMYKLKIREDIIQITHIQRLIQFKLANKFKEIYRVTNQIKLKVDP